MRESGARREARCAAGGRGNTLSATASLDAEVAVASRRRPPPDALLCQIHGRSSMRFPAAQAAPSAVALPSDEAGEVVKSEGPLVRPRTLRAVDSSCRRARTDNTHVYAYPTQPTSTRGSSEPNVARPRSGRPRPRRDRLASEGDLRRAPGDAQGEGQPHVRSDGPPHLAARPLGRARREGCLEAQVPSVTGREPGSVAAPSGPRASRGDPAGVHEPGERASDCSGGRVDANETSPPQEADGETTSFRDVPPRGSDRTSALCRSGRAPFFPHRATGWEQVP